MKATSCLEIFSRLIFSAATLGMILQHSGGHWEVGTGNQHHRAAPPDASQFGPVVMAIDDVVEDLQHQLPQLTVLHQGDGEERVHEGGGQRRCHGLGPEARGHLGGGDGGG